MVQLTDLPTELTLHILSLLPGQSLIQVCKTLQFFCVPKLRTFRYLKLYTDYRNLEYIQYNV